MSLKAEDLEAQPKKFNEAKVKKKLHDLEISVKLTAGKAGHNPFLWYRHNVQTLLDRYVSGEQTPELEKAILALPDEIPPYFEVVPVKTELSVNMGIPVKKPS